MIACCVQQVLKDAKKVRSLSATFIPHRGASVTHTECVCVWGGPLTFPVGAIGDLGDLLVDAVLSDHRAFQLTLWGIQGF